MSIGIAIQFLAGRFHATPWDRQVNEGVVEMPPSPWRVLRALVSAYYRLPDPPPRQAVKHLLEKLAETLPSYQLPPWSAAHTRHYMPIRKEGNNTTTKVFDTFLVLGNGTLSPDARVTLVWEMVSLNEPEKALLQQLCRQVSYLGRAESWAELSVVDESPINYQAKPLLLLLSEKSAFQGERVKVLAPLDAAGLEEFQTAISMIPQPKKGKVKWKAPADLMEALELNIGDLHSQSWNGIPGSRWVTYVLQEPRRTRYVPSAVTQSPTVAHYAVVSHVLPNLTQAISIGDRLHRALIKHSEQDGQPAAIFSGRDEAGNYRKDDHLHAWYLSEDRNEDGKIDHLTVYAAEGFQNSALTALYKLSRLWSNEGSDLQLVLLSLDRLEPPADCSNASTANASVLGQGRVWRSLTPVVLPRFPKCDRRGNPKIDPVTQLQIDGPEHQVRRLLKQLGVDAPIAVKELPDGKRVGCYEWWQFRRQRYGGNGAKGPDRAYGFELKFAEPQRGPISLGYGAHFGLGVFVPVD